MRRKHKWSLETHVATHCHARWKHMYLKLSTCDHPGCTLTPGVNCLSVCVRVCVSKCVYIFFLTQTAAGTVLIHPWCEWSYDFLHFRDHCVCERESVCGCGCVCVCLCLCCVWPCVSTTTVSTFCVC